MRRPSPATAIAFVALFVALSTSSIAAPAREAARKLITGSQIKDGSIRLKDIARKDRAKLKGARGPQGQPGPAGARGATGPAGPAGARGSARAYAQVSCINAPKCDVGGTIEFTREQGFKAISIVSAGGVEGRYCLTLDDALGDGPFVPVVSVEWAGTNAPEGDAVAVVLATRDSGCPSSADFSVRTYRGGAAAAAPDSDVGFTVLVP